MADQEVTSQERRTGLVYGLSISAGLGILLNLILVLCLYMRMRGKRPDIRYIRLTLNCVLVTYIVLGVGLILLELYNETQAIDLCKFAGFLTIFSTLQSVLFATLTSVILLLWIRATRHNNSNNNCSRNIRFRSTGNSKHFRIFSPTKNEKWNFRIFLLVLAVECIIVGIVSVLPLTNSSYFNEEPTLLEDKLYLCASLALPHDNLWGASLVIVLLCWISLVTSVVLTIISLVRIEPLRQQQRSEWHYLSSAEWQPSLIDAYDRNYVIKQWLLLIALLFDCLLWTLVLTVFSATYFSRGHALSVASTRWGVAYTVSLSLALRPLLAALLFFIYKKRWARSTEERRKNFACPQQLVSIHKMEDTQQVNTHATPNTHDPTAKQSSAILRLKSERC